jgi:hypothetical protein
MMLGKEIVSQEIATTYTYFIFNFTLLLRK